MRLLKNGVAAQNIGQTNSLIERSAQLYHGYQSWSERHPATATVLETFAFHAVKKAVVRSGDKIGIHFGNAHAHQQVNTALDRPLRAAIGAFVLAPVSEELQFRYLLSDKAATSRMAQNLFGRNAVRRIGILSSLGFASGHAFDPVRQRSEWSDPKKPIFTSENRSAVLPLREWRFTLPMGNLIGGEQYRRMYHKRGLMHAIGSHALNNLLVVMHEGIKEARRLRREEPDKKHTVMDVLRSASHRQTTRPGHQIFQNKLKKQ